MPSLSALQQRANSLLSEAPAATTEVSSPSRIAALTRPSRIPTSITPPRRFSAFIPKDVEESLKLTDEFMQLASEASTPEDGLDAVLQRAEELRGKTDAGLLQHALMVFIVHHPDGSKLEILPLEQRKPQLRAAAAAKPAVAAFRPASLGVAAGETQLDWYREDPLANQHHEHWHVVYPTGGVPVPGSPGQRRVQDRQGELFFYMHEQMLARYSAERRGVGLDPLTAFDQYRAAIAEGYDPHMQGYSARQPNTVLSDIAGYTVTEHEQLRDRIGSIAVVSTFSDGTAVDGSTLGAAEEPTIGSPQPFQGTNHHGMGHVLIAYSSDPTERSDPGVMIDTASAIRDPIFYRWHKHVDNFSFAMQERLTSYDFAADAPNVQIRKRLTDGDPDHASPDIILSFVSDLNGADPTAFGEAQFGGAQWNHSFAGSTGKSTDTLRTRMLQRQSDGMTIDYLDHDEFVWFLRVENKENVAKDITVRVFLAPVLADNDPENNARQDRRRWIEMDKFQYHFQPGQKAVIARRGADSSIIQKPALRPPGQRRQPGSSAATNYCTCGWPYNLLAPRGNADGMVFRVFVMLTDWSVDQVKSSSCGSSSYCGARDAKYPDSRAMGYPFDRPFPEGSTILNAVTARDNMATRDIKIQLV